MVLNLEQMVEGTIEEMHPNGIAEGILKPLLDVTLRRRILDE